MHIIFIFVAFRLFFVCKPVIPPMRLLEDTFKMFKGLRNINVIDGKNYGYVTYDSMESAARAINVIQIYIKVGF
jgi:hypothetical protein